MEAGGAGEELGVWSQQEPVGPPEPKRGMRENPERWGCRREEAGRNESKLGRPGYCWRKRGGESEGRQAALLHRRRERVQICTIHTTLRDTRNTTLFIHVHQAVCMCNERSCGETSELLWHWVASSRRYQSRQLGPDGVKVSRFTLMTIDTVLTHCRHQNYIQLK